MIIAAQIFLADAEFAELKAHGELSQETTQAIVARVRKAIQYNSFDVVEYVVDHVTNAEGELVEAGDIEVTLDD